MNDFDNIQCDEFLSGEDFHAWVDHGWKCKRKTATRKIVDGMTFASQSTANFLTANQNHFSTKGVRLEFFSSFNKQPFFSKRYYNYENLQNVKLPNPFALSSTPQTQTATNGRRSSEGRRFSTPDKCHISSVSRKKFNLLVG